MTFPHWQEITSAAAWHEILGALPRPHALQSWVWGAFKARWGWQARPLAWCDNQDAPLAAALVLQRQAAGLPFSVLYVPKGPILDYEDEPLRRHVLAQLEALARRERAIFVKIDPDVATSRGLEPETPVPLGLAFVAQLKERGWRFSEEQIQFRNTVELALDRPEEEILAAMKSKTRYNIRLAGRKDVVVHRGTPADFPTIAAMYETTAKRDDFTIRPPGYYLDIWTAFYEAGMAQPFIATYEGTPLGAVIAVAYGERAIYMYGASNQKERNRMPNYLLQWEAIRWAKNEGCGGQGCAVYDFWGAPDEFVESDSLWGVWRFKSGFNGDVVRHAGAWDFAPRPFWYWLYRTVTPRYLDLLRRRAG